MIETPQPITYQQLLLEHERIRIPRLQRDYAQGRTGAKETEVRNEFLEVLREALEREVDADFTPLNLDFVYGSAETVPDKHFSPLDGQQRLTTLFLLHWLLAWHDGKWEDFTERFREGDRARFAYRVRTSSNEFFDMLVKHQPPMTAAELADLKAWITDQPWYFRYWRLDPTVQAVIEMLQAMHTLFKDCPDGLYARLTSEERPAVTFQLLNLGDFPLSDDLYIKMNARGKPLTAFETFKASYEQILPGHFPPGVRRDLGGEPFPMAEFIARRLDTGWTDFFWAHHRKANQLDPQRLDDGFMNLFRMVAIASRDPEAESFRADIERLRDGANPPSWSAFKQHGWLDPAFSTLLVSLMESWCAGAPLPPSEIFPQLIENPAALSAPQVFIFCGYALFLRENEAGLSPAELAEWMRVVRNFGINSEIDRNERLLNPVKGLRELLPHSRQILPRIAGLVPGGFVTGFPEQQQREEALKAGLILADPEGWRPLIERAEGHGYFRGQVEFLLEFSGTSAEWVRTAGCAWDSATHQRFQRSFLGYLEKAEAMFDAGGLIDVGEARWQRALLSIGDYLLANGYTNWSFLVNEAGRAYSWKRLLRGLPGSAEALKRPLLKALWDRLLDGQPIPAQLDAIIAAANGLPRWQEALVKNAPAVLWCERLNIQRDGNHVVLLSRERRSAPHAELFTFLLARTLQPPAPFTLGEYFVRDEPHLPLHFPWKGEQLSLDIYCYGGDFVFWVKPPVPADLCSLLQQSAGFASNADSPGWIFRQIPPLDLDIVLIEVAGLLIAP